MIPKRERVAIVLDVMREGQVTLEDLIEAVAELRQENLAPEQTFSTGQRVVRKFDGAIGTVEIIGQYDGAPIYCVRLDKDGEIWQGSAQAWNGVF